MRRISRIARVIPQGGSSQVEKKQLVIGAEGWEQTSPFFFLSEDWFGKPKGFETHPHRGMQTVTIVLEGGEVRVHAGRSGAVSNPHGSDYPMSLLDIRLEAGARLGKRCLQEIADSSMCSRAVHGSAAPRSGRATSPGSPTGRSS